MFNRRFIHHQPYFQMRRGGTYKTYESPPFSMACGSCLLRIKIYTYSAPPPTECFSKSRTNWMTSWAERTGLYPLGFLPRVLVAVVILSKCIASSSWFKVTDAFEYSDRAALVESPWMVWALAIRCRPSRVCFPLVCPPPWNWHFWVLLVFSAGRPHWSFVRDDLAVHRAQHMRPPAVDKRGWGLVIAITQLSQTIWPRYKISAMLCRG